MRGEEGTRSRVPKSHALKQRQTGGHGHWGRWKGMGIKQVFNCRNESSGPCTSHLEGGGGVKIYSPKEQKQRKCLRVPLRPAGQELKVPHS